MHGKTLHWGICTAANICHDFVSVLRTLPSEEHQVRAIAASSLDRARDFAEKHGIPRAYGSYNDLAQDDDLDIIYVGSLTSHHFAHAKMMLESGKAVLCEKPLCTSVKDAKALLKLAKEKKVFLMEAIWSRCFPLYGELKRVIDDGEIGEVRMVQANFGNNVPGGQSHRIHRKDLGGGALFDVGIYTIQLAQFVFGEKPESQIATGFLNEDGVDVLLGMTLKYSNNRLASMAVSTISTFPNEANICGTKGFITVHAPFHCPTSFTVNGERREFPLPVHERPLIFVNSQGLQFEAMEVWRCLMDNLTESPLVTHAMTIEIAEITEKALKDVGFVLPEEPK